MFGRGVRSCKTTLIVLREAGQAVRAEIIVERQRHLHLKPLHYRKTGAVCKGEGFIAIAGKDGPGGLFVGGPDAHQLYQQPTPDLLAKGMGDLPAEPVPQQGESLIQDEIAGNEAPLPFPDRGGDGLVVGVLPIDQGVPGACVHEYLFHSGGCP